MDDRNYKNYKIALTHSKATTTSISPYSSHLNRHFFRLFSFSRRVEQNSTMYKKLSMFLNQMILDLFTRELFPIFSTLKNASTLPMAPAPANIK